jgi:hypothetical protein
MPKTITEFVSKNGCIYTYDFSEHRWYMFKPLGDEDLPEDVKEQINAMNEKAENA